MLQERERSKEQAEKHFLLELEKLQLDFELKKFGNPPAETVACYLFCRKTEKKVSEGGGKGIGWQSELSAKFEALEVFTGLVSNVGTCYEMFSLDEARSLKLPILSSNIFPELLESDFLGKGEQIPWIPYTSYHSKEKVYLPAICTHPFYFRTPFGHDHFDYSSLYLSQTTNGIASGCTYREALLHAVLEVIERHSLSMFIIETFLKKEPRFPIIIDIESLPFKLQKIAAHVVNTTGLNLLVYQMPNEMGIPVYGVLLYHEDLPYPIKGCGVSLDPAYAIERAMLEAMEVFHWDKDLFEVEVSLERLKEWPQLKPCAEYDLLSFVNDKRVSLSSFDGFIQQKTSSPKDSLDYLLQKLTLSNFTLFVSETYRSENLSTVHVIIPEAEDFFVVMDGVIVPIKNKGKEALCMK